MRLTTINEILKIENSFSDMDEFEKVAFGKAVASANGYQYDGLQTDDISIESDIVEGYKVWVVSYKGQRDRMYCFAYDDTKAYPMQMIQVTLSFMR
jgi:hypothetical protein